MAPKKAKATKRTKRAVVREQPVLDTVPLEVRLEALHEMLRAQIARLTTQVGRLCPVIESLGLHVEKVAVATEGIVSSLAKRNEAVRKTEAIVKAKAEAESLHEALKRVAVESDVQCQRWLTAHGPYPLGIREEVHKLLVKGQEKVCDARDVSRTLADMEAALDSWHPPQTIDGRGDAEICMLYEEWRQRWVSRRQALLAGQG